jgi:hypothetical protein
MRLATSLFVLSVATNFVHSAFAQTKCAQELKWIDATYAQRTTTRGSQLVKADVESFANASVIHLDINGVKTAMIDMSIKRGEGSIQLTFGGGQPKPVEFSEISMAVEPPMSSGDWPRMKGPCSIPDGENVNFDESDLPAFVKGHAQSFPKFRGTLMRNGLRIRYSMTVEDGETWQGEANYVSASKDIDVRTDVQGWHIFRANSYVETLPVGQPVSLLSVIQRRDLSEAVR